MASGESRLRIETLDTVTRIEFLDRNILDEGNIQQIGAEVSAVIDAADDLRMVIDFTGVDHLSSAALGALITINNKIKGKNGQLRLSNIGAQIYEVFVITKLNRLFEIYPTSDEAIKSFT
ncbi:MAG: STAS domain-containing protein [Phycisphaerales bacterium]|nr:STAS domain-containing protein [Phycisphaerales bacterium]